MDKKIYRVKQFIRAVFPKVTKEDKIFVEAYLNEEERKLFYSISKYDQMHSILVAKDICNEVDKIEHKGMKLSKKEIIKAALLHDIGKAEGQFNPIERSILVLGNKLFKSKMKRIDIKKIQTYYNHGKIGEEKLKGLKDIEYSELFLRVIRNHHDISDNQYDVELLRICDDRN